MINTVYLIYHEKVTDWMDINTRYAANYEKDVYRCIIGVGDENHTCDMAFEYINKKYPNIDINSLDIKYNDKLNQYYIQFIRDYTDEFIIMKPYELNVLDKDLTNNDLIPIKLVEKINKETYKSEFLEEFNDVKFGWIVGKDMY